jgi:hypothetical protein
MFGFVILIWIAVPVFIVTMLVVAIQQERKRKRDLEQAATDLGLTYAPTISEADRAVFDRFPISQVGRGRAATNAIVADSGELRMVIFDYVYTTGGGKSKKTLRQSVVLASSSSLQLPQFSISPESFFHRIGDLFGFKDIDFDDDSEFSEAFLLKGPDEPAVREFFQSHRRAAFMKFKHISVQASAGSFVFFQARKLRGVQQLRELMQESFTLYSALSASAGDR